MTTGGELLLQRVEEIGKRTDVLCRHVFGQSQPLGIDYLSVFTVTGPEYEELSVAAAGLGSKVGEKRGGVYRVVTEHALPTRLIRVCQPTETEQLGCVDVIPANFGQAREVLIAAGYQEKSKSLNGHDYTIIEAADKDLAVSIYVPSAQITKIMGITDKD